MVKRRKKAFHILPSSSCTITSTILLHLQDFFCLLCSSLKRHSNWNLEELELARHKNKIKKQRRWGESWRKRRKIEAEKSWRKRQECKGEETGNVNRILVFHRQIHQREWMDEKTCWRGSWFHTTVTNVKNGRISLRARNIGQTDLGGRHSRAILSHH
ncbi:uncharacterized protein LOC130728053 isoform X2 [Lotus japonicus]|uniref:uncharacterized protein LOC130728053 isoform X2 n=1 Tax=Lotus japonicus TaxID=34305 RepID=UPI00258BD970|nr:uncharacterized protein LOC130728053 isoform X2 [Lotus japonicus]